MRKVVMFLAAAVLICSAPALLSAQMCIPGQQCMVEPGLRNCMGMMSAMMGDMHQMLHSGRLTPVQQKHMLVLMDQMSGIMKDMGSPEEPQKETQIKQQLQQLQKELGEMKAQLGK